MLNSVRRVLYLSGLAIGGALFIFQVRDVYQALWFNQVQIASPMFLGAAWSVSVMATGLQMIGWALLMRQLGRALAWHQVVKGYSLSFLPRYIPGSVWGYLSRNEWLLRSHNIEYRLSNLGSVLEVLLILFTGGLIVIAYGSSFTVGLSSLALILSTILLIILVGLAVHWLFRSRYWQQSFTDTRIVRPLKLNGFLVLVLLYVSLWLCHGTMLFLIVKSLNINYTGVILGFPFIFYVAWTLGFVILFVPAGLGVREAVLSGLLVSIAGLVFSQAVTVSVLSRFIALSGEAFWVLVGLIVGNLHNVKRA